MCCVVELKQLIYRLDITGPICRHKSRSISDYQSRASGVLSFHGVHRRSCSHRCVRLLGWRTHTICLCSLWMNVVTLSNVCCVGDRCHRLLPNGHHTRNHQYDQLMMLMMLGQYLCGKHVQFVFSAELKDVTMCVTCHCGETTQLLPWRERPESCPRLMCDCVECLAPSDQETISSQCTLFAARERERARILLI